MTGAVRHGDDWVPARPDTSVSAVTTAETEVRTGPSDR